MFHMSQIQLMPPIIQTDSCEHNLIDEKATLSNKISSFKISTTSKQNIRGQKKSNDDELKDDDIKSITGRKIINYDWKYGMKHIPVWKTNQLLGLEPFSQQLMSPQNYTKPERNQEALRLSAKRVNIYHYKPSEIANHPHSKQTRYGKFPLVNKLNNLLQKENNNCKTIEQNEKESLKSTTSVNRMLQPKHLDDDNEVLIGERASPTNLVNTTNNRPIKFRNMKLTLLENERRTNVSCKRSSKCGSHQESYMASQIKWNEEKLSPDFKRSKNKSSKETLPNKNAFKNNTELCLFGQKVSRMESYPSKDSLNANCDDKKNFNTEYRKKREVISKNKFHAKNKRKNESLKELLKDYPKVYEDMIHTTESCDFNTDHLNSKALENEENQNKLNTKGVTHVGINENLSKENTNINQNRQTPCNRTNTTESMFTNFRGKVEIVPHDNINMAGDFKHDKENSSQLNIHVKTNSETYNSSSKSIRKKRNMENKKFRRTTAIISKTTNLLSSDESNKLNVIFMNEAKKMIESQTQALSKMNQRHIEENEDDIKNNQDLISNLTARHFDKEIKRNKQFNNASASQTNNSNSKSNKICKIILPNGAKIRFTHYNVKN